MGRHGKRDRWIKMGVWARCCTISNKIISAWEAQIAIIDGEWLFWFGSDTLSLGIGVYIRFDTPEFGISRMCYGINTYS